MTVGSLFAGIGGFDLGFERAGFKIKWQVEIDPFATAVLAEHWPEVERFDDIRAVGRLPRRCVPEHVDVLVGGFPCQDISVAGAGVGIDGERSGLWREFDRLIGELRPRYVVVENVSALLFRGLGRVLGDLAARGYDAEWDCLPASAFGAYDERDRVFIVAYRSGVDGQSHDLLEAGQEWRASLQSRRFSGLAVAARAERENLRLEREPGLARLVRGLPNQVDRLARLGNAVRPQITEWIARRILESEGVTA